jgi:hypothetical protein
MRIVSGPFGNLLASQEGLCSTDFFSWSIGLSVGSLVGWLVGQSVGRSVGWLVGWLVDWSVGRLIGRSVCCFVGFCLFVGWMVLFVRLFGLSVSCLLFVGF